MTTILPLDVQQQQIPRYKESRLYIIVFM